MNNDISYMTTGSFNISWNHRICTNQICVQYLLTTMPCLGEMKWSEYDGLPINNHLKTFETDYYKKKGNSY